MNVSKYTKDGQSYLEVKSRSYHALKELQKVSEERKEKTWMNLFNGCEGIWMLTVRVND